MDVRLPPLGEGANSGTVVNILVKEGDTVKKNQTLLELENEKAVAPIPSDEAGVISKIHVKVGDTVSVGQLLVSLNGGTAAPSKQEEAPAAAPRQEKPPAPQPQVAPQTAPPAPVGDYRYKSASGAPPPASPSLRKMARELGIDLTRVRGTEHGGRITLNDVRNYVQQLQQAAFSGPTASAGVQPAAPRRAPIDFGKWGPVRREKLTSLRKKIGEQMLLSWTSVPHVTQHDEVDVSATLALRKKHKAAFESAGGNLTLTVFILKALVKTLKAYPSFNASIDDATQEVVFKDYYHIGIAVDTEAGLIVPVIRDVDRKSMLELSKELNALAEKTRQRKVAVEDLKGGSFTISNQGSIGGGHFTPIINAPEVAILGIGKGYARPRYVDGKLQERIVLPISLSYDHRLIDGGSAARFVSDLVGNLQEFDAGLLKPATGAGKARAKGTAGAVAKAGKGRK